MEKLESCYPLRRGAGEVPGCEAPKQAFKCNLLPPKATDDITQLQNYPAESCSRCCAASKSIPRDTTIFLESCTARENMGKAVTSIKPSEREHSR